jgi:nucleoside-diphosphate-sugar epimerase
MKKALVIGATGGMGYALVKELAARGIHTIAFSRGEAKLTELYRKERNVAIFPGDAFDLAILTEAAKEADVIFHAMNIPYPEWEGKLPILMETLLEAARVRKSKLVIVDNIYSYGRSNGKMVTEETPRYPHTKKGKIRLQLESRARQTTIPTLIAHFPDFYGPNAENTLLHFTIRSILANQTAMFVGNRKIPREYIFTPDGAKALIELSLRDSAYGQNWNIPGAGVITGDEIIEILKELTGFRRRVITVTKPMLQLLGIFNKMMREAVEVMYLTEEPVVLDGRKLQGEIGTIPKTPYKEGIKRTLAHLTNRL